MILHTVQQYSNDNINSTLSSQKASHITPSWASYEIYILITLLTIGCAIIGASSCNTNIWSLCFVHAPASYHQS